MLLSPLVVGACSDDQSRENVDVMSNKSSGSVGTGERRVGVIGSDEEGSDSSGSMYYIPDDKIVEIAESADEGDNEALMKIINHYRFSYEGGDKNTVTQKWEKIAADREIKGVAWDYFQTLLEQRKDCSILKKYAEKAKKGNPEGAEEIDSELRSVCKN
ncbi:MAG: hypothetical protein ABL928_01920 [Sphingorhabdus sp.]